MVPPFYCLWPCSLVITSTGRVGYCFLGVFFCVLGGGGVCPGAHEGSTGRGSDFKIVSEDGPRRKVSFHGLGESGNQASDTWFTRHA